MKEDKNSKEQGLTDFICFYILSISSIIFLIFFNIITDFKSDLNLLLISILTSLLILFYLGIRDPKRFKEPRRPKGFPEKYPEEIKMAWKYVKSADARKQQTRNYLLVAESMLLFSFVTLHAIKNMRDQLKSVSSAIAIIGIVVTLCWFFSNLRSGEQISTLQRDYLLKRDRVYYDHIKSVRRQPSTALFLSNVLPCSIFLLWTYLLHFSINGIHGYDFFVNLLPFYILSFTVLKLLIEIFLPKTHEKIQTKLINYK